MKLVVFALVLLLDLADGVKKARSLFFALFGRDFSEARIHTLVFIALARSGIE